MCHTSQHSQSHQLQSCLLAISSERKVLSELFFKLPKSNQWSWRLIFAMFNHWLFHLCNIRCWKPIFGSSRGWWSLIGPDLTSILSVQVVIVVATIIVEVAVVISVIIYSSDRVLPWKWQASYFGRWKIFQSNSCFAKLWLNQMAWRLIADSQVRGRLSLVGDPTFSSDLGRSFPGITIRRVTRSQEMP